MKIKYYKEDDILVLKLSSKPIDFAEESDWIIIHYDEKKDPVRIEILDASRFLKEESKALPFELKEKYFTTAS